MLESKDKSIFLADFVQSATLPKLYKVSEAELEEILKNPSRLNSETMLYTRKSFDEKTFKISSITYTYYQFPNLFGEDCILSKVYFNQDALTEIDNDYLQKLQAFLDDLNNEDNLLGSPFPCNYILVERVSLPIQNYPRHSANDQEIFYALIK